MSYFSNPFLSFYIICAIFPAKLTEVTIAVIGYHYHDCVFTSWSNMDFLTVLKTTVGVERCNLFQ